MSYLTPIYTDRLIIRPFTVDDIDDSYALNLDERVSKYTGDGGVVSYQEIEHRINNHVLADYNKFGYGRMAVGSIIDFCGLLPSEL